MSATIVEHLITSPSVNDKGVELIQSEICRKMSIGAGWNDLCIGYLACYTGTLNEIVLSPGLGFGLTSNNGSLIQGSPAHWFGIQAITGKEVRRYTTYHSAYLYPASTSLNTKGRHGTTDYLTTAGGSPVLAGYYSGGYQRAAVALHFLRSGSHISVDLVTAATGISIADMPFSNFVSGIGAGSAVSLEAAWDAVTPHNRRAQGSFAVDEASYGDLDSVSIVWPQTQPLTVYAVCCSVWS